MVEQHLENVSAGALLRILAEMREVVPFDSASIQELRKGRLVIIGGIGFADLDVIVGESFEVDNIEIPNGEVIYRRRALSVGDTEQYRGFRRGLHVGVGIRSWLGVPLLHGDELVGMLALDKAEADFYDAKHQQAAMEYAARVAETLARGNAGANPQCA